MARVLIVLGLLLLLAVAASQPDRAWTSARRHHQRKDMTLYFPLMTCLLLSVLLSLVLWVVNR